MRGRPNQPRQSSYENEEYDLALSQRDRKRLDKQQKYTREQRMAVAPEDDAEGRREIGGKIMSNRGLTPHRSKDMKNPRVRLKNKFAKAVWSTCPVSKDVFACMLIILLSTSLSLSTNFLKQRLRNDNEIDSEVDMNKPIDLCKG